MPTPEEVPPTSPTVTFPVADPGFPMGGGTRRPRWGGAWTPEAVMFRIFCISKRKNLDPEGRGRAPGRAHNAF